MARAALGHVAMDNEERLVEALVTMEAEDQRAEEKKQLHDKALQEIETKMERLFRADPHDVYGRAGLRNNILGMLEALELVGIISMDERSDLTGRSYAI